MSRKRYYVPGVDELRQLEETPASKAITERNRFIITVVVSALATVASVVAAVFSVLTYLG